MISIQSIGSIVGRIIVQNPVDDYTFFILFSPSFVYLVDEDPPKIQSIQFFCQSVQDNQIRS
jgi:hypothetical protein